MQSQPCLLSRKATSSGGGGNNVSSIAAAYKSPHQYFPATASNLLRSIAKRRRIETAFAARLALFGERQNSTEAAVMPVTSGSPESLRATLKQAIQSFEVRTNRWPLEDRLAQTRHSITRFQPTLIRDVGGTPQFDRASYNKGMRVLLRIEEESQLPQVKEEGSNSAVEAKSWFAKDSDGMLDVLEREEGDVPTQLEKQPFTPHGILSSSTHSPPQQNDNSTEILGQVQTSPPWATALQYFQQDTIETGRQLSSDVRTRVLNVLTMAAQRRHEDYHGNASKANRSHPPMSLFLRWWVLLTVERDVGISKTTASEGAAATIPFNPFSFNFNNGTALACPWAGEWTPTCKRLLGRHWSQYGAPDDFLFKKPSKRNSDDRALVNELRLQQTLPVTLGRDTEGDEDSGGHTITTFFPQDPTLIRELLSTSPRGAVTGNRHANASIIPMLLRYNMWAEALRFTQGQIMESAGFNQAGTLPDSVSDSLQGAVYEVLTGKLPQTNPEADDDLGFCTPLFAPIHHGNSVAKMIGEDPKSNSFLLFNPTPRWAIALEMISVLVNKQLQQDADGGSVAFGIDPSLGTIITAEVQPNIATKPPQSLESKQSESAAVFLSECEVESPSLTGNVTSGAGESRPPMHPRSVSLGTAVGESRQHELPSPTNQDYSQLRARPTFAAFATLVSQRFGLRSQDVGMRGGYPWEAALEMCRSLGALSAPTSRTSLELTLLALRFINVGASEQLASLPKLGGQSSSILQLRLEQSLRSDSSKTIESTFKTRKQLLATALSIYGQAPPSHLQSPLLVRQALVAAVDVAIQHLTENLVSAAMKNEGPHLATNVGRDDNECIAALYEALDDSQKKSFAHILTLLCGSISERYIMPLQRIEKERRMASSKSEEVNGESTDIELFIPVSVANRIVQMCVAFCPSLRFLGKYDFKNEKGILGMAQIPRLFENSQRLRKSNVSKTADIFGDSNHTSPPEIGSLYISEKAQRHIQERCFDLDFVEGVDMFGDVRKLLELITTTWGSRVTETSAQFIPFAHKILRECGKTQHKSAATQAFEVAAAKATIPQLKAFAKSLLQSGSWKKALHVARFIDSRQNNELDQINMRSKKLPVSGATWLETLKNLSNNK